MLACIYFTSLLIHIHVPLHLYIYIYDHVQIRSYTCVHVSGENKFLCVGSTPTGRRTGGNRRTNRPTARQSDRLTDRSIDRSKNGSQARLDHGRLHRRSFRVD